MVEVISKTKTKILKLPEVFVENTEGENFLKEIKSS